MKTLSIWKATPRNIWGYRQNHPELVINDIKRYFPVPFIGNYVCRLVRQSLLCRGVNKWLVNRRSFIAYKKQVKHEVKKLQTLVPDLKVAIQESYVAFSEVCANPTPEMLNKYRNYQLKLSKYLINKELLKHKQKLRGDLKSICMSDRWQILRYKKIEDFSEIKCSD